MAEVPIIATPTNAADMTTAIGSAYRKLEGANPSGPTTAILLGLWDLETGGGKSTFNFNVGNLKAVKDQTFYVNPRVKGQGNHFAAYETLEEGVRAWLLLLAKQNPKRYATTWAGAKAGDTQGFAQAIEQSGYCSDAKGNPCPGYAKAVLGRIAKYLKSIPQPAAVGGISLFGGVLLAGLATTAWFLFGRRS
jgi:hypothetical protein